MSYLISHEKLAEYLKNPTVKPQIFSHLVSTNLTAKEQAASGADEGTLIIAEHQSGGRGRMGRNFHSPKGTGIYFSLILRPDLAPDDCILITAAAAVAVAEAVEKLLSQKAYIKWVNDIFLNGKKVCGILSEAVFKSDGKGMEYVILGIGINIAPPKDGFPKEIQNIAGALTDSIANISTEILLAETINRFMEYYSKITLRTFLKGYRERLMLKGQSVSFFVNGLLQKGKILDIDDRFRLKIEKENNDIILLSSGEVTVGSKQAAGK